MVRKDKESMTQEKFDELCEKEREIASTQRQDIGITRDYSLFRSFEYILEKYIYYDQKYHISEKIVLELIDLLRKAVSLGFCWDQKEFIYKTDRSIMRERHPIFILGG